MITAKMRRKNNILHKNALSDIRKQIRRTKLLVNHANYRLKMAWAKQQHFNEARVGGLVEYPKQMKLKYKINMKNKREEYNEALNQLSILKRKFYNLKYGKTPITKLIEHGKNV